MPGRQHLLDPNTEDLRPLQDEGFGAYARRVSRPYAEAVARHFDADRATLDLPGTYYLEVTERVFRQNQIAQGDFVALGRRIDLAEVRVPVYPVRTLRGRIEVGSEPIADGKRVA